MHDHSSRSTVVIDIDGTSDHAEFDAARFRDTLRSLLSQGCECVLVNLAQTTYIDSVMLGAIAQGYVSALRVGTSVKLLHASRRVKELLAVTKLDRVLETIESEEHEMAGR